MNKERFMSCFFHYSYVRSIMIEDSFPNLSKYRIASSPFTECDSGAESRLNLPRL